MRNKLVVKWQEGGGGVAREESHHARLLVLHHKNLGNEIHELNPKCPLPNQKNEMLASPTQPNPTARACGGSV